MHKIYSCQLNAAFCSLMHKKISPSQVFFRVFQGPFMAPFQMKNTLINPPPIWTKQIPNQKINLKTFQWTFSSSFSLMFLYIIYEYRKFPKYSDTQKICCNQSKIWTTWLYHRVMSPNDADGMTNSVDPDQTAPLGAVWSGSALFAQAYLSENLGSLR